MALFFDSEVAIMNMKEQYTSSSNFLAEIERVLEETQDDFKDSSTLPQSSNSDTAVLDHEDNINNNNNDDNTGKKQTTTTSILPTFHTLLNDNDIVPVEKLHYKMLPEETPIRTWEWHDVEWKKSIYLLLIHIGAFYGLDLLITGQISFNTCVFAISLYILGGLGITAGAHRLWTHRSYEAAQILELFLMICNSIANQGSIFHWSRDHVIHHKYSESIADPHDARRGFFFSHMGWLLVEKQPEVTLSGQQFEYAWLTTNWIVMHQHHHYVLYSMFFCFVFPAYICSYWNESVGGLFVAGFLRYAYTLHCTWTVNSLAHMQGERPYDPTISPSESCATSFFSMGEGWHNYHHTYPRDYACSEFGVCYRYNPTKLFIDICAMFGLVKNRKRYNDLVHSKQE